MNAREIALLTLQETEKNSTKSEQSLHRLLDKHDPGKNDSALATELVNGVLRFRLNIKTDLDISSNFIKDLQIRTVMNTTR